jgi:dihydrofolate reductase
VIDEVRKLKEQIDGVILVAVSSQLVHALIEHDLVDELRLMIHPVVLGSGRRLLGDSEDLKRLRLVNSQVMADVVVLTLRAAS